MVHFKDGTNSCSVSTTFKMSNTVLYQQLKTDSLSVTKRTHCSSHNMFIIVQVTLNERIIFFAWNMNYKNCYTIIFAQYITVSKLCIVIGK